MFRIRIDPAGREPFMEDANEDGHSVEPLAKGRRADFLKAVPHGRAALIQMAEYTGDLIGLCDAGGRLAYLNPAGRRLIGVEAADIFPMRLTDYVVPEQRHLVDEIVVPTARRDGVWEGEMQLVNLKTDDIIDVQRSTFATRDERGEITGFVSVMRDITHDKVQKGRLRRQIETFEALIANNPLEICLVDADFRLRVVSRGAQTVFENIHPLLGRDFADILRALWPEPFASEAIARFRQTLDTGMAYDAATTPEQRADIEAREAYGWRIERVTLPDECYGIVFYFHELIDREDGTRALGRREAELRDLNIDLERRVRARTAALNQANARLTAEIERREAVQAAQLQSQKLEAVGQLASGIAHDFNNILGAVIGGLTIIQNRNDDPRIEQIATMGQRAAERGAALVRQLLAFARQEDVVAQRVDLAGAIGEISDLVRHGMRGNVALAIDCDDDLWPVLADPTQLQSALLNLANNASDAMNGGGHLHIAVSNRARTSPDHPLELDGQDAIRIVVADNGPGMDSDTLQRITEPFFTTKARGKGTGLGLAMVQRFVEQSGGALRIESRPGHGTTFSIFLPRAVDPGASDPA
ncbi:MAG: PAS domain S-box protein, partial [Sphingomonas sp.]